MPESEKTRPSSLSNARLQYGTISNAVQTERDQIYVLKAYSAIGFVALTIFGLLHILVENNTLVGWIELVFAGVIALNVLGFRLSRSLLAARLFFLVSIMAVLLVLLITGGTRDTGIFWLFVFPNLAFFLAGKRQGLWWVGSLMVAVAAIVVLAEFSLIHTPYSLITMRQLFFCLAVVVFGVYVYQSARERALQEAHDSRRDLQKYLDHMTTFSVKISLSGAIILANKAAKEASGIGERLIGTSFLEAPWWSFDTIVQRRVEAAFYKVLTGQVVNYDEKFKAVSTRGSAILTVNFSMIPIFDKNQQISYVIAEARDISAEQAVDHAKSEFVGVASRQLQGPIVSAQQLSSRLLTGDTRRLNEQQRADIRELYRNSQHMTTIIGDMLLVSQLELANLPVTPRQTSVSDICQAIIKSIRDIQLKGRRLEINEEYTEHLPDIPIDSDIMRIILSNLITNAVKFTPDTGRVYVRIRRIDEKLQSESQGSLQIEVQDTGRGIPHIDQKKLFTKFFKASNGKGNTEGTGLGLYIVKLLVEYIGGAIAFQSEENVGSIFIVTLPIEGMHEQGITPHSDKVS
jgi:PAS domain S-box-containing protein